MTKTMMMMRLCTTKAISRQLIHRRPTLLLHLVPPISSCRRRAFHSHHHHVRQYNVDNDVAHDDDDDIVMDDEEGWLAVDDVDDGAMSSSYRRSGSGGGGGGAVGWNNDDDGGGGDHQHRLLLEERIRWYMAQRREQQQEQQEEDAVVELDDINGSSGGGGIDDMKVQTMRGPELDAFAAEKSAMPFLYDGRPIPSAPYGIAPLEEPLCVEARNYLFHPSVTMLEHSVGSWEELPDEDDSMPEVALAGRSNVGKSSMVNALLAEGRLASVSSTPGHTRRLHFYNVGQVMHLVDLPGYGFAEGNPHLIEQWTLLIQRYLTTRQVLNRVFVLVDSRHGLTEYDRRFLGLLDEHAVSHQIVLTKCDKISHTQLERRITQIYKELLDSGNTCCYPYIIPTSVYDRKGILELQGAIYGASGLIESRWLLTGSARFKAKDKEMQINEHEVAKWKELAYEKNLARNSKLERRQQQQRKNKRGGDADTATQEAAAKKDKKPKNKKKDNRAVSSPDMMSHGRPRVEIVGLGGDDDTF